MIEPLKYSTGNKVEWKGKPAEVIDIGGYTRRCEDIKYRIKYRQGDKEKTRFVKGKTLKLLQPAE